LTATTQSGDKLKDGGINRLEDAEDALLGMKDGLLELNAAILIITKAGAKNKRKKLSTGGDASFSSPPANFFALLFLVFYAYRACAVFRAQEHHDFVHALYGGAQQWSDSNKHNHIRPLKSMRSISANGSSHSKATFRCATDSSPGQSLMTSIHTPTPEFHIALAKVLGEEKTGEERGGHSRGSMKRPNEQAEMEENVPMTLLK
jgi:hypothetical protein